MIKTRFAPSPTGDLHIGGLRTALFAYLFTKKNNGEFFLRIEDTDRTRFKEGSAETIFECLDWTGIKYAGEVVYQSQRLPIYKKYVDELIAKKYAYYCFCSTLRLDEMRKEQEKNKQSPKYDRHCLNLSEKEIKDKLEQNTPFVIRMKIPESGNTTFTDLVRGEVSINHKDLDDQILLKSDGFPTYHLACVVDDHEMQITHVIRAEEWLPSTPKHIILYDMFGWQKPEFAHLSMILALDKSKLSKRHGATSVLEFKKLGYLPEALINYVALLGWNPGDEREIFSLKDLEQEFSLEKVQKAGAIFDIEKLNWMNGYYIRQIDLEKLTDLCLPYLSPSVIPTEVEESLIPSVKEKLRDPSTSLRSARDDTKNYIKKIIALEQERLKKLSDITELTKYFFQEPEYEKELLKWRKSDLVDAKNKLEFLAQELNIIPEDNWTRSALEELIMGLISAHNFSVGEVLWPMRVALTGLEKSPGPFEVAEVLGKEKSLERIKKGISML